MDSLKTVMVVDDTPSNLQYAMSVLSGIYKVVPVKSGEACLAALTKITPDLILLDIEMPDMNGFETLNKVREMPDMDKVPVIFLTALADEQYEVKGFELGAVDFIMKPFVPEIMKARVATQIELSDYRNSLEKKVEEKTRDIKSLTFQAITAITKAVDAKDVYTRQHSARVAKFAREIAIRMGVFDETEIEELYRLALLHDIGKIGIPDSILLKEGKLTDDEFATMKSHTCKGYEMLKDVTLVKDVEKGAQYHHERYDGRGYPQGLSGENIPLCARIVCIADAYDAMTSDRCYRKHLPKEVVRSEIEKGRGSQFDPKVVDIMLSIMDDGIEFPDED